MTMVPLCVSPVMAPAMISVMSVALVMATTVQFVVPLQVFPKELVMPDAILVLVIITMNMSVMVRAIIAITVQV
jgi:hypothetical protein